MGLHPWRQQFFLRGADSADCFSIAVCGKEYQVKLLSGIFENVLKCLKRQKVEEKQDCRGKDAAVLFFCHTFLQDGIDCNVSTSRTVCAGSKRADLTVEYVADRRFFQ